MYGTYAEGRYFEQPHSTAWLFLYTPSYRQYTGRGNYNFLKISCFCVLTCARLCCQRCEVCAYSASDHNTMRRHRMRHTGQKPYHCAFCSYTAIQAIGLKTHMRARHPRVTSSTEAVVGTGTTMVYSCQSCRYQTVNRQSWLDHVADHRSVPVPPVTSDDAAATEQLFVIQKQDSGQLVLAPLVHVTDNSDANPSTGTPANDGISVVVEGSQPGAADQHGLRHILTAISEQQQGCYSTVTHAHTTHTPF